MKIKNYELEHFIAFLDRLKLERTDSRLRTRFKKLLFQKYDQFSEELHDINMKYVKRDESGNPQVEDDRYTFENNDERLKEIHELSNEFIVIDQNEENKKMLLSVKESVLYRGPNELEGKEADIFDCLAEIVEQINYDKD